MPPALTGLADRLRLLRDAGAAFVVLFPTDATVLGLAAEDFAREVLRDRMGVRLVVVGENFRFGRGGAGDIGTLRRLVSSDRSSTPWSSRWRRSTARWCRRRGSASTWLTATSAKPATCSAGRTTSSASLPAPRGRASSGYPQRGVVAIIRSFGSGRSLTITGGSPRRGPAAVHDPPPGPRAGGLGDSDRGDDARYEIVLPSAPAGAAIAPQASARVAAPVIEDLSAATKSDVRLGVFDCLRVLYVEKAYGGHPLSEFSAAAALPAHATALGKVLLAFSPTETVDNVVRHGLRGYTASTVTTAARTPPCTQGDEAPGMAVASGELLPGHCAVAVPVFGPAGELAASLEVRLRDIPSDLPGIVPRSRSQPAVSRGTWDGSSSRHRPGGPVVREEGPSRGRCRRVRSRCRRWRGGSAGGGTTAEGLQPALR